MYLLAIETTGAMASIALMSEDEYMGEVSCDAKMAHLRNLIPMIKSLLSEKALGFSQIDGIAVSEGPGSFTGIRIGVSSARALGQAASIPIVSVPTLKAMAYHAMDFPGLLCPIFDARRNQVYSGIYKWNQGACMQVGEDGCYLMVEVLKELQQRCKISDEKVLFLGDGVEKHRKDIALALGDRAVFAAENQLLQSAESVARLGMELWNEKRQKPYYEVNPEYLRKPEAVINLEKSKQNGK